MDHGPLTLVSDAPLDEHTTALLRSLAPAQVVVADANEPAATLRAWAEAARDSQDRLVLVDSTLRAEANALANLLDDPRVGTAVLLAHNAIEGVNSDIHVDDRGHVGDTGDLAQTAGIMVVAHDDCAAFADALEAAARSARSGPASHQHPWDLALFVLSKTCPVDAVPAAPFCASREGMELPTKSEHDRRLRAAAGDHDDVLARTVIRPASRPLTAWAVTREIPPRRLAWTGFGVGTLAAAAIAVPGLTRMTGVGSTVLYAIGALLLIASGLAFLSSGEAVRYLRRPEIRGQRLYSLTRRMVDVLALTGIAVSAIAQDGSATVLAAAAIAAVGVSASLASSGRIVAGADTREYWPMRWLATALALMIFGPVWALIAATAAAVGSTVHSVMVSTPHRTNAVFPVTTQQRFLTSPGVLIDAGVPVRLLSHLRIPGPKLAPRWLVLLALAAVAIGATLSWGGRLWPLALGAAVAVFLISQALRAPLQGGWAWLMPTTARVLEFAVIITAASFFVGAIGAVALIASVVLLTGDIADRWRLRRRPPAAWVPLAGLGFDGRMLATAILGAALSTSGALAIAALAALVAVVWAVAALGFWRPTDAR